LQMRVKRALEMNQLLHENDTLRQELSGRLGPDSVVAESVESRTLLLDEIGDISVEFHAKLLRVLQEGEVLRVGGSEPRRINVRVVAATNSSLQDKVAAGTFREDLYFRLNVIPIQLLPLRQRRADILALARTFLGRLAAEAGRHMTLDPQAVEMLLGHSWPGNVRELENAIERAVVLTRGDLITAADLMLDQVGGSLPIGSLPIQPANGIPTASPALLVALPNDADLRARRAAALEESGDVGLSEYLDKAAGERIALALAKAKGNRAEAARSLGIGRATLYRFMRRLGNESSPVRPDSGPGEQQ
jgi:DNA-binding NtrC family response regulator